MNEKKEAIIAAIFMISLVVATVFMPSGMAMDSATAKKSSSANWSGEMILSVNDGVSGNASCVPAPLLPESGGMAIDSMSDNGQWYYYGYFDGSVTTEETDLWAYYAPSGTAQTYVYLTWDNVNNDVDLYTYDHNWQDAGYSIQAGTEWEAVQNTNAYNATWYIGVNGYSISDSQQYHGEVYVYVVTHDGQSSTTPWSGWWWPWYDSAGAANLFDSDGAMFKYDSYVYNGEGTIPGAFYWEYNNHRTTDPNQAWFGHCHAWSAASILEQEPTVNTVVRDVEFEVGDQKGLLSECHYDDPIQVNGSRYNGNLWEDINDIYPNVFHKALVDYIGVGSQPLVMDISRGTEVWNYPAYSYSMKYDTDLSDPSITHVTCNVTFADDNVDPDFVGTSSFPKTYTYYLTGGTENPTGGMWEGDSVNDHPDFVWYPTGRTGSDCPIDYADVQDIVS